MAVREKCDSVTPRAKLTTQSNKRQDISVTSYCDNQNIQATHTYPLTLLILCGKREIIRLPPFEPAKAPGYIESERNDGQHHYQEPVPEKPKPCSVKGQWAIVDKGVF
jgi:hypothetical protein